MANQMRPEPKAEGASLCTMELVPVEQAVRRTIPHGIDREGSTLVEAASGGWPKILPHLKSLRETGAVAFEEPHRREQ